jgi:SPP1 gp7 family putative phage head morphogenesis protein
MQRFLAALTPSVRVEVDLVLSGDELAAQRLEAVVNRYIDDEGNWPEDPFTADYLARTFLHRHADVLTSVYGGSGLKGATAAALAGGAVSLATGKGAVVLSSNLMANYWQDVLAYSSGMHPLFVRGVKRVFDRLTADTRWEQLAKDLTAQSAPDHLGVLFGDRLEEMLAKDLLGIFARQTWRGTRSALTHFAGKVGDVAEVNPWVENYVRTFATNQRHLSERTIRQVLNSALDRGLSERVIGERLRQLWPLSPQHAHAVERYRANLLRQDRTPRSVNELAKRYAGRLLETRLKTLTTTEMHTAFNLGREAQWLQAIQTGELPAGTLKMWVTAQDELTCKVCRPMDGMTAPLGQPFDELGIMVPGAHPNCRCIIVPVEGVADFSKHELVFPTKQELAKKLVHVEEYEREDGTKVKEHFRHLRNAKVHDDDLRGLKEGAYDMPMSWLREHIRGSGIRLGQRNRIKSLANSILADGFTKPITVWVYEDGPFVRDGMHRLEAAHELGLKRIPVAIHHVEGQRPKTDLRGRYHGWRIRREGDLPLRDTPFRNVKQEEGFVRWFNERMSERGEQVANNPDAPPKKKFQLFTKADDTPIRYEQVAKKRVWVEEHLRNGQKVEGHWRNVKGGKGERDFNPFSGPLLSGSGESLTDFEKTTLALTAGIATKVLFRQAVPLGAVKAIKNPVQTLKHSKDFHKGLYEWVSGGTREFRILLEGKSSLTGSYKRPYIALADGLDQLAKRPTQMKLYRGMSIPKGNPRHGIESFTLTDDLLKPGHTFDMAPSSFTRSKWIANSFTSAGSTKHGEVRVVMEVNRGSRSARVADVSPMPWEREYIGWGTYRIDEVKLVGGVKRVKVTQTETYSLGNLARRPQQTRPKPSPNPNPKSGSGPNLPGSYEWLPDTKPPFMENDTWDLLNAIANAAGK